MICTQMVMIRSQQRDYRKSSLVPITGRINPAHAGIPLLPYNASEYSLPSTPTSPKLSLSFGSQTRFLNFSNRSTSLCWHIQLQSYLTIIRKTALFRDITQRRLVSPCRRFDTTQLLVKFHKPHVFNSLVNSKNKKKVMLSLSRLWPLFEHKIKSISIIFRSWCSCTYTNFAKSLSLSVCKAHKAPKFRNILFRIYATSSVCLDCRARSRKDLFG